MNTNYSLYLKGTSKVVLIFLITYDSVKDLNIHHPKE